MIANLQNRKKGPKRSKAEHLKIDATIDIQPDKIPAGSTFKGYREVVIQDILFETFNTCYRLAQYQTPDGSYVSGQLPDGLNGGHFGNDLISFIRYQYHHQHITQPLLLKQLQDLGVAISSGRLSQFITDGLDVFHDEKDQLLQAGLSASQYVQADDTGARHDGKNGYGTHPSTKLRAGIGNELFAWFSSTESKSRINFLSCLAQGIPVNFSIVSDDAGPFNVFNHALGWIHAERIINRLIALNDDHIKAVDAVREQLWQLYCDLKDYKLDPTATQAEDIKSRFHIMRSTKTAYATLNQALKWMGNNQHELLRVLDQPYGCFFRSFRLPSWLVADLNDSYPQVILRLWGCKPEPSEFLNFAKTMK